MKKIIGLLVSLVLVPVLLFAQEVKEFSGRVKSKTDTEVVIQSRSEGEKTFAISGRTQGVENAKEGASVVIKYGERDGKLTAREIAPRSR
jgi:hypothetical protein